MTDPTQEDLDQAEEILDTDGYEPTRWAIAQALADQRLRLLGTARIEYRVRDKATGWVYALPKLLPKFLDGQRDTKEAAEWHLRQIAGPDPEDQGWAQIVWRVVTQWEVQD